MAEWVDTAKQRAELMARQVTYGEQIVAWLRRHFSEWNDHGPTHPGAIVAVIHLHHRYGKGQLTMREHGNEIREAVARWERAHGPVEREQQEA